MAIVAALVFFLSLLLHEPVTRCGRGGSRSRSTASRSGCSAGWRGSRATCRARERSSESRSPGRSCRSCSPPLRNGRRRGAAPRGRRRSGRVARLHERRPVALQHAAGAAARRRPRAALASVDALADLIAATTSATVVARALLLRAHRRWDCAVRAAGGVHGRVVRVHRLVPAAGCDRGSPLDHRPAGARRRPRARPDDPRSRDGRAGAVARPARRRGDRAPHVYDVSGGRRRAPARARAVLPRCRGAQRRPGTSARCWIPWCRSRVFQSCARTRKPHRRSRKSSRAASTGGSCSTTVVWSGSSPSATSRMRSSSTAFAQGVDVGADVARRRALTPGVAGRWFPCTRSRTAAARAGVVTARRSRSTPHPLGGEHAGAGDREQVAAWWHRWPDANVAVATGRVSGVAVLDIDPRSGGDDVLRSLERRWGELPDTVEAHTGGGGRHVWFAVEEELPSVVLAPGLELKAERGAVVAPPSLHASGERYSWVSGRGPDDLEPRRYPPGSGCSLSATRSTRGPRPGVDAPARTTQEQATFADTWRRAGVDSDRRPLLPVPFHPDHHPSLHVDTERCWWFCFGCRRGGGLGRLRRLLGEPAAVSRGSGSEVVSVSLDPSPCAGRRRSRSSARHPTRTSFSRSAVGSGRTAVSRWRPWWSWCRVRRPVRQLRRRGPDRRQARRPAPTGRRRPAPPDRNSGRR